MPEIPEHIKDTMTLVISNMAAESQKMSLTLSQVIRQMGADGTDLAEIERVLINDLRTGGQIFGDFRANFKSQMRYGLERTARNEVFDAHKDVKLWVWVAIGDDSLCDDCDDRNGDVMTLDEWKAIGIPGAGTTICQDNCRCGLAPEGSVSVPEGGIMRKKP
jgi:hypothetical protein